MKTLQGNQKEYFTNRQLITLIWPLVIEQALAILVGTADTVMVSSAGEAAISGVSLVDMINQLIFQLFAALATGGAVVTAQAIGAKDPERVSRSVGQLVLLSAILGTAVMGVCLVLRRGMLRLFFGSIEDSVMNACLVYFTITLISYPFLALYNAGAAIFRAVGNSGISMKVSVLVNAVNFAGNALCIYVLKMGIAGVAVPTLISRIVGAAVILRLAARTDGPEKLRFSSMCRFEAGMAGNILNIGIPSAFEGSLFQLGRVLVVSMISLCGTVHISANAIANNVDGIGCIVGNAIGLATVTVVGQCVGTGDMKAVKRYALKLLGWDYVIQGAGNILLILLLGPILKLYSVSNETQELSRLLILIHLGSAIILWPSAFVLPNALRAANDVRFTMVTSVLSMAIFRLGVSYLLCVHASLGAVGVWIAMVVDWCCRAPCFWIRFLRGSWKKYCPGAETVEK